MTLDDLYRAAIEVGLAADLRGREALDRHLAQRAAEYAEMSDAEKRLFDVERLTNPFGDTRIVNGAPDTELQQVLLGIDIGAPELALAAELMRRGRKIDAVISHHASAIAGGLASRYDTAIPQVEMAMRAGLPEPRTWHLLQKVIGTEDSSWDLRVLQIAEALEVPLMTIHSPADSCLDELLRTQIAAENPETAGELLELIEAWPECQLLIDRARRAPHLDAGEKKAPIGEVYRCAYGGWNPTPELFEELCRAGVGTFVVVASTAEFRDLAGKYGANILVIPHYAADNAGINIMLDRIMPDGDLFDIVEASNYVRCRRRAADSAGA